VKPNAAPSPSREIAFRREIISVLILSFTCCLPSLTIVELEWRQLNAITSMSGRKFGWFDGAGWRSPSTLSFAVVWVIAARTARNEATGPNALLTNELTQRHAIRPLPSPEYREQ
jgi:hypothetical protein